MLNIFDAAPDFSAYTGAGPIGFHRWKGAFWSVMILYAGGISADELAALGARQARFERREVKVLAVTPSIERGTDPAHGHLSLAVDMDGATAGLYGVGGEAAPGHRAVFIVSPSNRIAIAIAYPAAVPLDADEILRLIDSAQMTKYKIATPADWKPGDDMVAGRVLPDPIAAARFGALREVFHYLRFVAHPPWEMWRADRP
jgi:alkyl hydroperoxide reductase subunit AhpC